MEIKLHLAQEKDVPLIRELAERIWEVHYTPIIGKQQVDYMLKKLYSLESLSSQMKEGQQFHIIYSGNIPIGYVSVSQVSPINYFLNKFYIEIDQQGKGIGKKIFAELLLRFPELKTMRLQVNRMNFKTINFYFRLGFVIEEAKDFDIGDGYLMEDFVMLFKYA